MKKMTDKQNKEQVSDLMDKILLSEDDKKYEKTPRKIYRAFLLKYFVLFYSD